MNNAMLGLFNLGGGEIILILFLPMFLAAGTVAVVLIVVWFAARQNKQPRPVPPVQPASPVPPLSRTCPRCGSLLPTGAPEGLCPRCVLGVGLATHTEAPGDFGPQGTRTLQPPSGPAEIAKHFPQLEILECLGRGGMGAVYKARQQKLNRLVALKILAPEKGADPKFAERFLREAQALARLSHPNIVAVHDFGEADGLYYLLMEYVDGVTLRQLLHGHKIAPEQALKIVPKICEALQFAHELGIVHRDIKPENVLLDKQGRVKIADFGIAKLIGVEATRPSLTEEQSVIGTPHYMAPEQVEKPQTVDHRADIYSLGVVFYEMLTGELPLGKFQPPSKKVQVDVRLDEVVLHALEKEPERRYQKASQVKTDLETIAATAAKAEGRSQKSEMDQSLLTSVATQQGQHLSRTAIWGAVWAPLFFLIALTVFMPFQVTVAPDSPPPGPAWWQIVLSVTLLPLGLTAPFGTTVLGWIAISQVRHSQGRLHGLGLAVFDGLLFPLLALDALIGGVLYLLARAAWYSLALAPPSDIFQPGFEAEASLFGACVILTMVGVIDFYVARRVWRAMIKPPGNGQPDCGPRTVVSATSS
jgi:serine/threonine protein kinase/ribosomal protein S27AE